MKNIKRHFPILNRKVHDKRLVYLDSAATSQKPKEVIDTLHGYYSHYNANIHRGIHKLSEEATVAYEEAHTKVGDFIHAKGMQEIVFTRNTTESLNLLAYSLTSDLKKGDEIVLTEMEHHSNIVPWQQLAKQRGLKVKYIGISDDGVLDMDDVSKKITKKTNIVSLTHVSNVLGTINPVKEIGKIAHEHDALVCVDGAQAVPHMGVDVGDLDVDFYAFSSHKMCGPTGVGVLWGREHLLEKMQPFLYGGDMIKDVTLKDSTFNDLPWKFEAGTPTIGPGIGLGRAVDFLSGIGMESIFAYDRELVSYAFEKLSEIDGLRILGPSSDVERGAVFSFVVDGVHSHDVATLLDTEGIAVRSGHHCCMPLMKRLGLTTTTRASFYLYNTKEDVDALVGGIERVKEVFKHA